MAPFSVRITSGEPAFAQAVAHSTLIGFERPLVEAHAESSTYPFTTIDFPSSVPATSKAKANVKQIPSKTAFLNFITPPEDLLPSNISEQSEKQRPKVSPS